MSRNLRTAARMIALVVVWSAAARASNRGLQLGIDPHRHDIGGTSDGSNTITDRAWPPTLIRS